MSVLLAAFTTTGFRQIFVKEVLGSAFDSQAEHFLHGNIDVDGEAIRHEAIIVNGKARMYFGPFPAFLRIPLNFICPTERGNWSRLSGLCAAIIALTSFTASVADALKQSTLSARSQSWFGGACIVGFAFGSPVLLLVGNLSIYDEAMIWAFAWSLAALFFLNRAHRATVNGVPWALLAFSLCAGAALLSRSTFGLPFLLITPALAFLSPTKKRLGSAVAICFPVGVALIFYLLLSYARFGNLSGVSYSHYINPVHRNFAANYGAFSLVRIPFGFIDYFSLRFPKIQPNPPFLLAERPPVPHPQFYSLPFSETYLSVVWSSSWLLLGAIIGIVYLFQQKRSDLVDRWVAVCFFVQFLIILSHFSLAERYATELYPFLVFCFLIFLKANGSALAQLRLVIAGLVAFSIAINTMTTVSWLIDSDQNVPEQTRDAWRTIMGVPQR